MKKIAFALQVFTLMIALPLYVIVEMNHAVVPSTKINTATKLTKEVNIISTASTKHKATKI